MKTRPAGIGSANAAWMGSLPSKLSAMPLKHLAVPGKCVMLTDFWNHEPWPLQECVAVPIDATIELSFRLPWLFYLLGGCARACGTWSEAVREVPGHSVQCPCQESHGEVVHDSGNYFRSVQVQEIQNGYFQILRIVNICRYFLQPVALQYLLSLFIEFDI